MIYQIQNIFIFEQLFIDYQILETILNICFRYMNNKII